ncbi:MAG: hypothetical protein ACP5JH_03170 [Bacteroidota bacterium]
MLTIQLNPKFHFEELIMYYKSENVFNRLIKQCALIITAFASLVLIEAGSASAQGKWYFNGYFQISQGNYIFGTNTMTFYFTPGVRYESDSWNFSVGLPLVTQNTNLVTRVGDMLLPHGGSSMGTSGMGSNSGMSMMGTGAGNVTAVGFGDLYLSGDYWLLKDSFGNYVPGVALGLQVKVPTASTSYNFGTGKFDYGATMTLRKMFGTFVGILNFGYLVLGSPAGINLENPLMYGTGIGKFFGNDFSALVYFQGYSRVLYGYAPPNQASLGLSYQFSHDVIFNAVVSKGLTETAPSISLSGGFRCTL